MFKICSTGVVLVFVSFACLSQEVPKDTNAISPAKELQIDTSLNYDELLNELDLFLDSLLMPRSYFMANISGGSGYFSYPEGASLKLQTKQKLTYSPAIGYYHKSGPGIALAGNITDDGERMNFYQASISPSFDFIKSMSWTAGISYTRFITKDSLPFYLSPLQNEFNGHFTWRKSWLQPGISVNYGWGSRTEFKKREKLIKLLRQRRGVAWNTTSKEDVSDFSMSASVRHSFFWMHIGGEKNYLRFTPQLSFSAGTQNFGFNHTTSAYSVSSRRENFLVYNFSDITMDEKIKFQPLSLMLYLRPEYNIGKFFIQPQFILDYYIPAADLAALFAINAGVIL